MPFFNRWLLVFQVAVLLICLVSCSPWSACGDEPVITDLQNGLIQWSNTASNG